jgi:large subunit ribosomal protein L1
MIGLCSSQEFVKLFKIKFNLWEICVAAKSARKNRQHHERRIMAKTKTELLNEADKLGLSLSVKNTIAEIQAAIDEASAEKAAEPVKPTTELGAKVAEVRANEDKPRETDDEEEHFAKAGKRSEKAVREDEAEAERQARKESGDTTAQGDRPANDVKGPAPKTRPRAERKGKNYKKLVKDVDLTKVYNLKDAMDLAIKTSPTKFDATVEIHARLGVDPRQADQNIRATVSLPNGTGKTIRVAAFVPDDQAAEMTKNGADVAGETAIMKLLEKENLEFDVLVATPQEMPKLGKFARVLGPRGLMPNPKSGTVSTNPAQAVKEAKAGKVEYRVDKQAIVHLGVGKVSFGAEKLVANAETFLKSLASNKPTTLKGQYVISLAVSTTMGPGIKLENNL